MPKRKKHFAQHTLVTGHSGAGKSTLARSFGLPVYALDDDPDIREQLNRQMAYARANQGRLPTGKRYARDMQRAEERAIERAMALKDPHVIEGSYLLNRDPEDFKAHNMHLVDTPEDVVLDRRVERQRVKDIARNRHWDDARAQGVRMRGQQLINEYAPGVKRWRTADYVKKASFRNRIRSIEIPPEFGRVTDRYYQTHGQSELIAYGHDKYTDYHNPRSKRTQRMEDMYQIKTAEKTKRRMSHVDPDKYNDNFRLGQMVGTGAAGMSLGAAIGGLRKRGTNKQALGGAFIGAGTGALLGRGLYRRKSDAVVYDATKRTPRHRVRRSLLADIKNVDPTLLSAPDNHFMTEAELRKTASKGVATKTDPAAWARAKAQARAKMGGKHSARAMQLATQIYKKNGGGYSGAKPSSGTNKLKKWTKQKWQWSGKDTPGPGGTGVYLPKRSSEQLKSTRAGRDKLRAASAAKRAATNSGRQFSSHGLHVGKKRSDVR